MLLDHIILNPVPSERMIRKAEANKPGAKKKLWRLKNWGQYFAAWGPYFTEVRRKNQSGR